jgi:murein DD-endopeptidase MepM/ murein hydrolase activator NlpD
VIPEGDAPEAEPLPEVPPRSPTEALPKARDPRMDRPPEPRPRVDWQLLFVPQAGHREVRRVRLPARELAAWRVLAGVAVAAALGMVVLLGFAWPRSSAYGDLVRENLELKERLDEIDERMGEVDRILLRLRVYDAQLDSVAAPRGDHGEGGIPEEVLANHPPPEVAEGEDLEALLSEIPLDGELDPVPGGPGAGEEEPYRTASAWAGDLALRLDRFLAVMVEIEPDVNRLLGDLEAVHALQAALPRRWPAEGMLTSGYGFRRNPFGGRQWRHHSGIDIGGQRGYPVYAAADGTVTLADWDGGYGRAIRLDHGYGLSTLYGHMSRLLVRAGDRVQAGQKIGLMGSTGRSTGPHLHFEVHVDGHPADPFDYLSVPPEAVVPGITPPPLVRRFGARGR